MADDQQIKILMEGVSSWNRWRNENPEIVPDLRGADLSKRTLEGVNFKRARLEDSILDQSNLSGSNFYGANLAGATLIHSILKRTGLQFVRFHQGDLTSADMEEANLFEAQLHHSRLLGVNLKKSNLTGAEFLSTELGKSDLSGSNCYSALFDQANLRGVNLRGASLEKAQLIETNLEEADLSHCKIYGFSSWNLKLPGAIQKDLVIANGPNPVVTLDGLEPARLISRFLYFSNLLKGNKALSFPLVLILGSFPEKRRPVLEGIKEKLRSQHYIPVSLESPPHSSRLGEFLLRLSGYSVFIIADLTDAGGLFRRIASIVPDLKTPVQPIEEKRSNEAAPFREISYFPMFLPLFRYEDLEGLRTAFSEKVIHPAELKFKEAKARQEIL